MNNLGLVPAQFLLPGVGRLKDGVIENSTSLPPRRWQTVQIDMPKVNVTWPAR